MPKIVHYAHMCVKSFIARILGGVTGWLERHSANNTAHRSTRKGGHDGDGNSWSVIEIPDWDAKQRLAVLHETLTPDTEPRTTSVGCDCDSSPGTAEDRVAELEQALNHCERVAQLTAHRACIGAEHCPEQGRIHGYCIVCGVPWPCDYAGQPPPRTT
jgi:hypothetical protein